MSFAHLKKLGHFLIEVCADSLYILDINLISIILYVLASVFYLLWYILMNRS